MAAGAEGFQGRFHQRWSGLAHPHVRALAWLLDSPGLLDPHDPHWQGRIASLPPADAGTERWLHALDADPAPLLTALGARADTRLGLYAEKLMSFYYRERGLLLAHGLQVKGERATVGEFDFLLDDGAGGAVHIEFATKFYLLEGVAPDLLDTLVGPNLADSLGQKMRKITGQQLQLASHPAAQAALPRPVTRAQALVKGWLFYPRGKVSGIDGLDPDHCRGLWCELDGLDSLQGEAFVHLPRMQWLAPWQAADEGQLLGHEEVAALAEDHFAGAHVLPLLVAGVRRNGSLWQEVERSFVVPPGWRARAASRRVA
ncbi:MAG: DUF1853 family protein [Telluria sp.]